MAALVDKFRPITFDDFVGQKHAVIFFNSILKNVDKYPKNIIINGPFGTGKTSIVKIFVDALKKIKKTVLYEFDSAQIGNKENLKDIKMRIDEQFTFTKDYKVLLFDEMQETSPSAQSLFMTTLENNILDDNSDRNIFFFFLTTNSSKIIDPVISRCIELNFLFISKKDIKKRILFIIEKEEIVITNNKVDRIVELSEGHLRNAVILLDRYNIIGDDFDKTIFNIQKLIYDFIFGDNCIDNLLVFPVNILIKDLNKMILKYVETNLDKNYIKTLQFFEIYMKFKKYVQTIEDFVAVIKILKKYINLKK